MCMRNYHFLEIVNLHTFKYLSGCSAVEMKSSFKMEMSEGSKSGTEAPQKYLTEIERFLEGINPRYEFKDIWDRY